MTKEVRKAYVRFRHQLNKRRTDSRRFGLYGEQNKAGSALSIGEFSSDKLVALLRHAFLNVPYYRCEFEGIGITSIEKIEPSSINLLPILTKEKVKGNFQRLQARNIPSQHLIKNSTSGSSGTPFHFLTDRQSFLVRERLVEKNQQWIGILPHDRRAWLWGAAIDFNVSIWREVHDWLAGKLILPSNSVSADIYRNYARRLQQFEPALLVAYPSSLVPFLEFCSANAFQFPSIKAVVTSAETLYPWQRSLIETILAVPVYNRYGCREVGDIAHETLTGNGLRINADHVWLEAVDEKGLPVVGSQGELLVTDLDCYGMPLIRYKIGDSGQLGLVDDLGYPELREISGRSLDVIKSAQGVALGGTYWTLLMRERPGIAQFKITQSDLNSVEIRYVKAAGFSSDVLDFITEKIHDKLGLMFSVRFLEVSHFDLPENGKFRVVESFL